MTPSSKQYGACSKKATSRRVSPSSKQYGACSKKATSRRVSIIEAFRNLTGRYSIHPDGQYWTLCGPMADHNGELQPMCELNHMLDVGLLSQPSQFCAAEKNPDYHVANMVAIASMKCKPHLYLGEMHTVLEAALAAGTLRPALVNLDTLYEPRKAARLLGEVLYILNRVAGPKMVVLNTIIEAPHYGRRHSLNDLTRAIQSDRFCTRQLSYGWCDSEFGFVYNGTGRTNFKMGTAIYFQPYQEAACSA